MRRRRVGSEQAGVAYLHGDVDAVVGAELGEDAGPAAPTITRRVMASGRPWQAGIEDDPIRARVTRCDTSQVIER